MVVLSLEARRESGIKMLCTTKASTVIWKDSLLQYSFIFAPEYHLCYTFQLWFASVWLTRFLEWNHLV